MSLANVEEPKQVTVEEFEPCEFCNHPTTKRLEVDMSYGIYPEPNIQRAFCETHIEDGLKLLSM